jgi:hypothetical protein
MEQTTLGATVDEPTTTATTPLLADQADLYNHHQSHLTLSEKAAMWARLKEVLSEDEKMNLYASVSRAPTATPLEDLQKMKPTWADRIRAWHARHINDAPQGEQVVETVTVEPTAECPTKDV